MQPTTIRFNEQERKELEELKIMLGKKGEFGEDSETIKIAVKIAKNVIQLLVGDEFKLILQKRKKFEQ